MSKFSERLSSATNEDKQVNPIYVQAIAKELPKVGCIDNNVVNGIDTDTIIYQIKGMLKQYDPEGLKQFNELYKQLEDESRRKDRSADHECRSV